MVSADCRFEAGVSSARWLGGGDESSVDVARAAMALSEASVALRGKRRGGELGDARAHRLRIVWAAVATRVVGAR